MENQPPQSMSRIHEKDCRDYEFIFGEIQRFQELLPEEQMQHLREHPWDALGGLEAPTGAHVFLSEEAKKHFAQIATRGLKGLGSAAERHNVDKVIRSLKEQLVNMALNGFEPSAENAHDVFDAAIQKLETTYSEVTYYVPCAIVSQRAYDTFTIGPVSFVLSSRFFKENEEAIRHGADCGNPEATEKFLARARTFYADYQWIARITVPPCDPDVSRRRAHVIVQKALDTFKLFVGRERAIRVKQAYDLAEPSNHSELTSSPSGEFSIRYGGKMQDAVLNDQWYEQARAQWSWPLLESALANYWNTSGDLDELQGRFFDALSWHSDAISEPDLGASIVKFWTAIERILTTSRGSNIPARVAALRSETPAEFEKYSSEVSFLYQKRSDIVHGSARRTSESWYHETALACEEASRGCLFQYLDAIRHIRAHPASNDRKRFEAWLSWLDGVAKHRRRQIRAAGDQKT